MLWLTRTFLDVGTTGLIFGAIVVAWLAYLVPMYLRRNGQALATNADPSERFSNQVKIISDSETQQSVSVVDHNLTEVGRLRVSTPLTRRAQVADLKRSDRVAAGRRRNVLIALSIGLLGTVVFASLSWIPWWSVAIPGGLVLAFAGVARFSVVALRRNLDRRYAAIMAGHEEETITLSAADVEAVRNSDAGAVAQGGSPRTASLWEPLPITKPTYVSKPLAPRTVRTIDLSGPELAGSDADPAPVTADTRPVVRPVPKGSVEARPVKGSATDEVGGADTRPAVGE